MFTGLIEATGKIKSIEKKGRSVLLAIDTGGAIKAGIGDSVAINGACLTVTKTNKDIYYFDVSGETIKKTSAANWKAGQVINLETSLKAGDELGGHFVTGHVDEVGSVREVRREGQDFRYRIQMSEEFSQYLVPQGSVAIDGISLTVAAIGSGYFEIVIIPHTIKVTNIKDYKVETKVNLEADMLGKYVVEYLKKMKGRA